MNRIRLNSELAVNVAVAGAFLVLGTYLAGAEEPAAPFKPVEAKKPGIRNYGLDEFGEPLKHLQPLKPRTKADEKKVDSVAWYMTGQLRERRNDLSGALKAYRNSVDLNPGEPRVYRSLVPLAFQLNQIDLGVKYAIRAAQIDTNQNYQWMRQLSRQLVSLRRFPQAVEFLEKAKASKSLKKKSTDYVLVHRDLALLYGVLSRKEKAADAFEVVFDALLNREKYNLSARRRRQLERDPLTNFERIGNVFLEAKRIDLAVKAFEAAVNAGQGQRGSLGYNLAQVYHQTKQDEKALTQLEKYFEAQLQSKGRDAYQLLADIFKGLEKSDALIGRLEELAEKDLHNSVLQFYLAEQYLQNDRLDDAEKTFKKGIESGNPEGHAGLAAVYRRQNRPAELLEAMANAVKRARSSSQLQVSLTRLQKEMTEIAKDSKLLEALLTLGRDAAQTQQPPTLDLPTSLILAKLSAMGEKNDVAIEFYHYAVDLADKRVALVYAEFGQFLMDIKRYAEAVTLFQQAVDDSTVQQGKAQYLYNLSRAQSKKGDPQAALKSLAEARKLLAGRGATQVPQFDFQEALIYFDSKLWDQAIEAFKKYISAYPQDREMVRLCRSILSSIYVQKGDMKKGEEILEQMFAEDPEDPTVNNDLGYLYAEQGIKLEQAEKMIRKAIKAQPENAAYLDSLGWVLFKLNRVEEAVPPLEKAASKPEGQDATIFDHLGDCYDRLNRSEKAVEFWKKALEFAKKAAKPDQKVIQKIEDKLKKKADE